MNTEQKINYLVKKLEKNCCPTSELHPYAMRILRDCELNNKSIKDVEIIKKQTI